MATIWAFVEIQVDKSAHDRNRKSKIGPDMEIRKPFAFVWVWMTLVWMIMESFECRWSRDWRISVRYCKALPPSDLASWLSHLPLPMTTKLRQESRHGTSWLDGIVKNTTFLSFSRWSPEASSGRRSRTTSRANGTNHLDVSGCHSRSSRCGYYGFSWWNGDDAYSVNFNSSSSSRRTWCCWTTHGRRSTSTCQSCAGRDYDSQRHNV